MIKHKKNYINVFNIKNVQIIHIKYACMHENIKFIS